MFLISWFRISIYTHFCPIATRRQRISIYTHLCPFPVESKGHADLHIGVDDCSGHGAGVRAVLQHRAWNSALQLRVECVFSLARPLKIFALSESLHRTRCAARNWFRGEWNYLSLSRRDRSTSAWSRCSSRTHTSRILFTIRGMGQKCPPGIRHSTLPPERLETLANHATAKHPTGPNHS